MIRLKRNDRPVLLDLPVQILEQVDMAVREQGSDKYTILNAPTDGRERAVANALGITISRTPPSH